MAVLARSLYLYENLGIEALEIEHRGLYLYENLGLWAIEIESRALYAYENIGIQDLAILLRALYLYEATRDGEVFPWLMKLSPDEQIRGGQVDLYGDGFGEIVERGADIGNVITASSTEGGNVPGNVRDRAATEWRSNGDGAAAWLRITFTAPRTIIGVSLEDTNDPATAWGAPLFRFSDGGPDVNGGTAVPDPSTTTEYPVGSTRTYYAFAPRTTDWIEVRVAAGGGGANRGLSEVWVYSDEDLAAESSQVLNNVGLITEAVFGIVSWQGRSPGLYPANSGLPILKAATVTVPNDAESGMLVVREND